MTATTPAELVTVAARLLEIAAHMSAATAPSSDDLMTAAEILAEFGMGRAALDARGVPRARVGRAYRWRRSAVEAAIRAAPATPRPQRKSKPMGENVDPLDQMLAAGELRRTR